MARGDMEGELSVEWGLLHPWRGMVLSLMEEQP